MGLFDFAVNWTGLDRFYLLCAIAGGTLFILRLGLGLFGGGDHDTGMSGADGAGSHDIGHHDTDFSFKLLTLQGLTGFFIMFGLVGLALHRGSGTAELTSIIGGLIAGVGMAFLMAKITQLMQRLKSSGTINMEAYVGSRGVIYLHIPEGGTGQAQVNVRNRLRIIDAVAQDKQPIKTGEPIEVVEVINSNLMVVKKI